MRCSISANFSAELYDSSEFDYTNNGIESTCLERFLYGNRGKKFLNITYGPSEIHYIDIRLQEDMRKYQLIVLKYSLTPNLGIPNKEKFVH